MFLFQNHRLRLFVIGLFAILFSVISIKSDAQKLLPDTIFVDFKSDTLIPLKGISVSEISDTRREDPRFIRYGTKRKFLFIPVDQEVYTNNPLAEEIGNKVVSVQTGRDEYKIEIQKFEIQRQKGRISSTTLLTADLAIYKSRDGIEDYFGTFYYDYPYRKKARKETLQQETENLLAKWHSDFKLDLLTIKLKALETEIETYSSFISDTEVKSSYLNTAAGAFIGIGWWGLQGEVFFTRPETRKRNHYWAGIIRYNNNSDYESFAIGKRSEHYYFRMNEKWLLDFDLNFLIGFCKWRDVEIEEVQLYQIFDFELSSIQSIQYNPMNSKGMFFRIGLTENLLYVIPDKLKFQVGALVSIGVKI